MKATAAVGTLALAVLVLVSPSAGAGTVTVEEQGWLGAVLYTNQGSGGAGLFTWKLDGRTDSGDLSRVAVGDTFKAFCIEAKEYTSGGQQTYDVVAPRDAPNTNADSTVFGRMGTNGELALEELFASSYYRGDADDDWTAGQAAAFQLAVWEIVYEFGNVNNQGKAIGEVELDLDDGSFRVIGATVGSQYASDANAILSSLKLDGSAPVRRLEALSAPTSNTGSAHRQDQVTWAVPLPPAAWSGLLLLAGLVLLEIRRVVAARRRH